MLLPHSNRLRHLHPSYPAGRELMHLQSCQPLVQDGRPNPFATNRRPPMARRLEAMVRLYFDVLLLVWMCLLLGRAMHELEQPLGSGTHASLGDHCCSPPTGKQTRKAPSPPHLGHLAPWTMGRKPGCSTSCCLSPRTLPASRQRPRAKPTADDEQK